MNKARLNQEYTISGCWVTDTIYGICIGLGLFAGLVMFLSW